MGYGCRPYCNNLPGRRRLVRTDAIWGAVKTEKQDSIWSKSSSKLKLFLAITYPKKDRLSVCRLTIPNIAWEFPLIHRVTVTCHTPKMDIRAIGFRRLAVVRISTSFGHHLKTPKSPAYCYPILDIFGQTLARGV